MEWIIEPVAGFQSLPILGNDTCTGDGTKLNSCACTGGLIVCQCTGGLVTPPQKDI